MKQHHHRFDVFLISLFSLIHVSFSKNLFQSAFIRTRRLLNLGSTFGSPLNSDTVYDRIIGHPVFAVTTAWGSPYMNMERLTDPNETVPEEPPESIMGNSKIPTKSISDDQNELRMVVLYFMDPEDALEVHGEMNQMENLKQSDIRLTCFSLGKALRAASSIGRGLVTGVPVNDINGELPEDNGRLRYKIVPPKRQIYYATRCVGRERIGLLSETPLEDAKYAIAGSGALDAINLQRRWDRNQNSFARRKHRDNHMDGYTGVPVFYCESMQRRLPFYKRFRRAEKPFFFDYEDLMTAWNQMRTRCKDAPEEPVVEVFNFMDVLSSMDRDVANNKDKKKRQLDTITFVPSSKAVHFKEEMSRRGNGKCRLRPMR